MAIFQDAALLRIYVGEAARHKGRPLHEALVEEARLRGMAGATVTRGMLGFGGNSLVHTPKLLRLSEDMPVVVEIVDRRSRIEAFLPHIEPMVTEGTMVMQPVQVLFRMPLRLRDVMRTSVPSVAPDAPLDDVLDLLLARRAKTVPVVEKGTVVGVITGSDLLHKGGLRLRVGLHELLPAHIRTNEATQLGGKTARDVMTTPVLTIPVATNLREAAAIMREHNVKRLPVLDGTGALVGVVTRVGILRALANAAEVELALPALPSGLFLTTAGEAVITDVPTTHPQTPLAQAVEQLMASPLRRVVVLDDTGKVCGILLDRDMLTALTDNDHGGLMAFLQRLAGHDASKGEGLSGLVADVMRGEVYTVGTRTPLREVLRVMADRDVKRLVVTTDDGKLAGMLDRDTLLGALLAEQKTAR